MTRIQQKRKEHSADVYCNRAPNSDIGNPKQGVFQQRKIARKMQWLGFQSSLTRGSNTTQIEGLTGSIQRMTRSQQKRKKQFREERGFSKKEKITAQTFIAIEPLVIVT